MIKVIDSVCGKGKTTYIMEMMRRNPDEKYIYITPRLSEIERIKRNVKWVEEPITKNGSKLNSFIELLNNKRSIASTTSLFHSITENTVNLDDLYEYTLILDEVFNVVEPIRVTASDIKIIKSCIDIDENGKVRWLNPDYKGVLSKIKLLADNGSLYFYNNILLWVFPVNIFKAFKEVYICTYLFDYQIQKYYYELNNIRYEKLSLDRDRLIPYKLQCDNIDKINIIDHKINYIGDSKSALSLSWFLKNKNSELSERLRKNMVNFRKNLAQCRSKDILWTTYGDYTDEISDGGYIKGFLSHNERAINDYGNRHYVMYCLNKFMNPVVANYFKAHDVDIDEDMYALSEMVQFLYRSAVRHGEEIFCYIPSSRMRNLLIKFKGQQILYDKPF